MKLSRSVIIKIILIILGVGLLIFIVKNYQPQQAQIISQQQEKIATQLALNTGVPQQQDLQTWQVFYNLEYTGLENFQVSTLVANTFNQVALLDATTQQLLLIDLASKSFELLSLPNFGLATTALAWDGDTLLAYSDALYAYQQKTKTWQPLTSPLVLPTRVTLLQKFDQNYYLFGANTIQKLNLATNDGQKNSNWLNEGESVGQNLIDVWIDGTIFVSDQNLGLRQYLRGREVATKIAANLVPPLYLAKKSDDFFVLSSTQGEITRFNENGEALQTWSEPLLQGSRWLWFNAEQTNLFVLKDNLLYNLGID
ncbi:MAG: hypothetical protein Q4G02_00130 [bacterium]|nr:hypothetical protein [bacterium]